MLPWPQIHYLHHVHSPSLQAGSGLGVDNNMYIVDEKFQDFRNLFLIFDPHTIPWHSQVLR